MDYAARIRRNCPNMTSTNGRALPLLNQSVETESMDEQTARRDICSVGRLLYERSYVVSSDGNISVRLDDGRIVATPTMTCKGRMTEDSLAITDAAGKPLGNRKPSR